MKYKKIWDIVKKELSCSAHSIDHIERVYNLCILIAKTEIGVDIDILLPSAILHDIGRVKEDSDLSGKVDHAVEGSIMAEEILAKNNYSKDKIDAIKHCILTHRFRSDNKPQSIEAKILFDADKIDVLGAVGICRCYMYGGQYNQSMLYTKSIEEYKSENITANGRIKNPSLHSPDIEYELKLRKIPDKLFTKEAKKIAVERVKFMDKFFSHLRKEVRI